MEQHPIPRQITTFEFKLIGFMTLKQFLYLLVTVPTAFIVYKIIPLPIINFIAAGLVCLLGIGLAFFPVNERPLDVWIKNLLRRLTTATQFSYHKNNSPLYFLEDLYFLNDPHKVISHIESKEKLAQYLQKTQPKKPSSVKKQEINTLLNTPMAQIRPQPVVSQTLPIHQPTVSPAPLVVKPVKQPKGVYMPPQEAQAPVPVTPVIITPPEQPAVAVPQVHSMQHAYLTGVVKNNRQIPLPGVLVYIKNQQNVPLRLLKTNPHGIFASYSPLPDGDYTFEVKDPNGGYFFDTMKVHVPNEDSKPYELYSKELM
jgi:hypothetical protein